MDRSPNLRGDGFSLVEVIVALVLLTIGVLGLAAASRSVVRMTSEAARIGAATALASARVERLRAGPCPGIAAGTAVAGALTENWSVTAAGEARIVSVTVTYGTGAGPRTRTLTAAIACAPVAP